MALGIQAIAINNFSFKVYPLGANIAPTVEKDLAKHPIITIQIPGKIAPASISLNLRAAPIEPNKKGVNNVQILASNFSGFP